MQVKDLIVTGDAKILGNLYTKEGNVAGGSGGGESGDSGVTYRLSKSGSTITLTGSDGSTSSVTDANTDTNTTYGEATTSTAGLMSPADKRKLNGIASGANNYTYTHPSTHPASMITGLAKVATSGSYNDLSNKPTIPAAYSHPSTHPASMITGLAKVATSGSYNDLSNKPTIPTVPSSLPANGGNADTVDNKHASDFMAASNPTGTGAFSLNRKSDTIIADFSVAIGYNTTADGLMSFAEGSSTKATDVGSHAEGYSSEASGAYSHAEGNKTIAGGDHSHAEGYVTTASGAGSHAEGDHTTALNYQHAQGHYNDTVAATAGTSKGVSSGTAFVIGNGTKSAGSNAFRVDYNGTPYAKSALTTTGCDYAEFFEWLDGNPDAEDRRGYFVTLDEEKIKKAEPGDYILGIVSGQPSIIGNGDESWMGRYVMDDFGAFVYEPFEYEEEVIDHKTGEVACIVKKTGTKYKENPNYDPSKSYIQRADRPEWSAVGMLGVLSVWDDGTCEVNGYCKVTNGGIATKADTGYRVIKRVNKNIVKVIFK